MAVTTTLFSNFVGRGEQFMNNLFTAGNQGLPAVAAHAARSEYFGVWTDPNGGFQVEGHLLASDLSQINGEFTVNATNNTGLQFDGDVAGLAGGGFVAVYNDVNADPGGDIRAVLYNSVGARISPDFAIDASASDDTLPAVAALSDGGFVVTWMRDLGGGNQDIRAGVFNADGSPRPGPIINGVQLDNFAIVDGSPGQQTRPDVAGLANGNFVAVWEDDSNHTVYFRLFNSFDTAIAAPRVPIDGIGTINMDIRVVGLSDGGFAVAYTDNGWGISGTEITFQIFNANGTARTGFIRANDAAFRGIEAGDQDHPTITTLDNGMIVVGWQDEGSTVTYAQVFDAAGNAIGTNQSVGAAGIVPDFAGLSAGELAVVRSTTIPEGAGNGTSIITSLIEFKRQLFSDTAGDTLVGLNDGLHQVFVGLNGNHTFIGGNGVNEFAATGANNTVSYAAAAAGVTANLANASLNTGAAAHDTYDGIQNLTGSAFNDNLVGDNGPNVLLGGAGDDQLTGGAGNDRLDGGAGIDTAVFTGALGAYATNWSGQNITLNSAVDGFDTTHGIERFQFSDGTVMQDDGNALVDDLYYDNRNLDVWNAHVDADTHFAASGWHEGRDPNAFFSTKGYLSANSDVRAANVNPLDQYHTTGWLEGRDPSASFDTELYLLHNPDVAAAHIDPLEHFLALGREQGRQAFAAVGRSLSGDFDSEFYLLSNPDVGFAAIDPLAHYNASGRHEGRNPDAFFDTAGYLAAYADVAASGMNPLDHYHLFGWKEGRDPSGAFDTRAYLAANPDVAAAHIDPLQHFLRSGIYEGRSAHGDGLFAGV